MHRRLFLASMVLAVLARADNAIANDPPILATGTFRDGDPVHRGSGKVRITGSSLLSGPKQLGMLDVKVVSGPNLRVYLVREPDPLFPEDVTAGFHDLGPLQSLTGDQTYAIPADIRQAEWGSVVVWCDTFKTAFAIATLVRH